jgi:hypothetical protein
MRLAGHRDARSEEHDADQNPFLFRYGSFLQGGITWYGLYQHRVFAQEPVMQGVADQTEAQQTDPDSPRVSGYYQAKHSGAVILPVPCSTAAEEPKAFSRRLPTHPAVYGQFG